MVRRKGSWTGFSKRNIFIENDEKENLRFSNFWIVWLELRGSDKNETNDQAAYYFTDRVGGAGL
jgi:hypothetical protein